MKGIILAAGKGTRLYPTTTHVPKPLLPIYDKPLIYYPLSLLIQSGIKDILIIVPPGDMGLFKKLFSDGSDIGINISYIEQPVQRGIADAFILGKDFIGKDKVCLMLGDNIFIGGELEEKIKLASKLDSGANVFGYYVDDPRPFGVIEFDENGKALSIEEKPSNPKSNYIVPGMYFYDNEVIDIASNVKPSARGELEITTVNEMYMEKSALNVFSLDKSVKWFDAGTPDSMLHASEFIASYQKETGKLIACIEEAAYDCGFIGKAELIKIGEKLKSTPYGQYILRLDK